MVSKQLQKMSISADPFVVVEKSTIEKPFGWVVFYISKQFLDTGITRYRLAGNGPVFVNKTTGAIEFHGSGKPIDEILKDYEKKLSDGGSRT